MFKNKILLFSLLAIISINFAYSQQRMSLNYGKVAEFDIDIHDIQRIKCIELEDNIDDDNSFVQIVNILHDRALAKELNLMPTLLEIDKFYNHILNTSKLPLEFKRIEDCFSGDRDGFNKLYLEPTIINNKLHDYHSYNKEFHTKPRELINKAFKSIANKKSFEKTAKELNLSFYYDTIIVNNNLINLDSNSIPVILSKMNEGELYHNIYETNIQFLVLSLVKKEFDKYIYVALVANKDSYDKWFINRCNYEITVNDKTILEKILTNYPSIFWTKNLKSLKSGD